MDAQYTTGEEWRNSYRKNEEAKPKQKQCPAVVVSCGESKILCYKEQYCIIIWNIKFEYRGKLNMAKQEMTRVNINILGVSELKWTGMGKFNSDDHYICYCRQESLRRNGVPSESTKEPEIQYLGAISKMTELSLFFSKASVGIYLSKILQSYFIHPSN